MSLIGPTKKLITRCYADDRNFYKVEKWTKDGTKIDRLLYAGNNLDKARELFAEEVKRRPRIRLTIRQRGACCSSGRCHNVNSVQARGLQLARATEGVGRNQLSSELQHAFEEAIAKYNRWQSGDEPTVSYQMQDRRSVRSAIS